LCDEILGLIERGDLKPGTKLPSIRKLAGALDVNNTTVVTAYKQLEQKAAVYSVTGSGTFVAKQSMVETFTMPVTTDGYINFADTLADPALFPVTAFRRAFDAVLERDGGLAFGYHDTMGYGPLRESICRMLGEVLKATPDCIQVISGAVQGIDALTNVLLKPGDTVFVEQFTSQEAVAAFLSKRAQVIEMPMTEGGPDIEGLEILIKKHRPRLIYVMPNFQTPTGICYSAENKARLLELALEYDAYILEEDQYGDIYYDGERRQPMKADDSHDRVIYIKSFSKTLMPDLRMGFIVYPEKIAGMKNADTAASGYIQRGFDLFLRSGAYESHCAYVRTVHGRRYSKISAAVNTYLTPFADFKLPGGGLSLWITPHKKEDDIVERFLQRKVIVSPGRMFTSSAVNGFRICYGNLSEEKIAEGIGVIASVLAEES